MNKVKLVIWDLDETFWTGTLSEGAVKNPHVELVKRLATHGIVNSISSKNDFEQAKKKLEGNRIECPGRNSLIYNREKTFFSINCVKKPGQLQVKE